MGKFGNSRLQAGDRRLLISLLIMNAAAVVIIIVAAITRYWTVGVTSGIFEYGVANYGLFRGNFLGIVEYQGQINLMSAEIYVVCLSSEGVCGASCKVLHGIRKEDVQNSANGISPFTEEGYYNCDDRIGDQMRSLKIFKKSSEDMKNETQREESQDQAPDKKDKDPPEDIAPNKKNLTRAWASRNFGEEYLTPVFPRVTYISVIIFLNLQIGFTILTFCCVAWEMWKPPFVPVAEDSLIPLLGALMSSCFSAMAGILVLIFWGYIFAKYLDYHMAFPLVAHIMPFFEVELGVSYWALTLPIGLSVITIILLLALLLSENEWLPDVVHHHGEEP